MVARFFGCGAGYVMVRNLEFARVAAGAERFRRASPVAAGFVQLDVTLAGGSHLDLRLNDAMRCDIRCPGCSKRGQAYALRYASVELELTDSKESWRWPAMIGLSDAPIRYPLLGMAGSLQFMDVTYHGQEQMITLDTNTTYPGDKTAL